MAAVAHSPEFAKKAGVPMSVGKDFVSADKGKTFRDGGVKSSLKQGINKQQTNRGEKQLPNAMLNKYIGHKDGGMMKPVDMKKNPGLAKLPTAVRNKMGYMRKGGMTDAKEDMKMDKSQDKAMIKKAFSMHDKQEHKGEHTNLSKLRKGGMACAPKKMASGGKVAQLSKADGCAVKGKSKGTNIKMNKGGAC
jgi:hypothetical protein